MRREFNAGESMPGERNLQAAAPPVPSASPADAASLARLPPDGINLKDHIEAIELALIRQALAQSDCVVAHAAKLLNTRRTTLVEKFRKYGLTPDDRELTAGQQERNSRVEGKSSIVR